jgi:heme/copper-type cytochrome/quinol oxidase subunit 2
VKAATTRLLLLLAVLGALAPVPASACAVCMGDPADPITQSIGLGILFLLAVILSVLGGIAGFFAYIVRRAASMEGGGTRPETPSQARKV